MWDNGINIDGVAQNIESIENEPNPYHQLNRIFIHFPSYTENFYQMKPIISNDDILLPAQ